MAQTPETSQKHNSQQTQIKAHHYNPHKSLIIGVSLYYAVVVDSTMLVALGTLAAAQIHATINTTKCTNQFLYYAPTHPDASPCHVHGEMILHVHSDAAYLLESEARSRAGEVLIFSDPPKKSPGPISHVTHKAVHINSQIMKVVLASAAEAKAAACF
jgi:hypothetical protein